MSYFLNVHQYFESNKEAIEYIKSLDWSDSAHYYVKYPDNGTFIQSVDGIDVRYNNASDTFLFEYTLNPIFEYCVKSRNGRYCHVLEVYNVEEYKNAIEAIYSEHEKLGKGAVYNFFDTMQIYCTEEENEEEVYSFDLAEFIEELN